MMGPLPERNMDGMKNRSFWTRFFLVASLLAAVLIFFFSAQEGPESAELSQGVTLQVAKVVCPDYPKLPKAQQRSFLQELGLVVRKCAHFSEYALLGFCLAAYLRLKRWEKPRLTALPLAWGIATLYACTDELHQMFVSERGPAVLDVLIDSGGALTGVLIALLGMLLLARLSAARSVLA